jgi:hypothetical protein
VTVFVTESERKSADLTFPLWRWGLQADLALLFTWLSTYSVDILST